MCINMCVCVSMCVHVLCVHVSDCMCTHVHGHVSIDGHFNMYKCEHVFLNM